MLEEIGISELEERHWSEDGWRDFVSSGLMGGGFRYSEDRIYWLRAGCLFRYNYGPDNGYETWVRKVRK